MTEHFDSAVRARINHERARAFHRPVLRSMDPDAIVAGYSIVAIDGIDTIVETNQVLRSTVSDSAPTSFSIRTAKSWDDAGLTWRQHAMDYLMMAEPAVRPDTDSPAALRNLLDTLESAPTSTIAISVDGQAREAAVFTHQGAAFARMFLGTPAALVTIAAPLPVLDGGFTSQPAPTPPD